MRKLILALSLVLAASSAMALQVHDADVVLPLITRSPGASGILWRSDVFLSNPYSSANPVKLTFYPMGGTPVDRTVSIPAFGVVALRDVLFVTLGVTTGTGQLHMQSTIGNYFEARALIYSTGSTTQYRQGQTGLGWVRLRPQAFLYGLTGNASSAVHLGISNPNNYSVTVITTIRSITNVVLHTRSDTVGPHQTRQLPNIFSTYAIPPQDVQVEMHPTDLASPIYGYGYEVRTDTGAMLFYFGTSPNV